MGSPTHGILDDRKASSVISPPILISFGSIWVYVKKKRILRLDMKGATDVENRTQGIALTGYRNDVLQWIRHLEPICIIKSLEMIDNYDR